jgi:ribosomal silencing factor RsfS
VIGWLRDEELAERRRAHSIDHAGLEVEKQRAWYVLAARDFVVKHVFAAELRTDFAAVLAVATDTVLVA